MSDFSFFWHDYETFGTDTRRDRPVQFAGIRTDADLNEIEAPVEVFSQPTSDQLPHPEACLITGITPQMAEDRGLSEPDFARAILAELGRPGTCGVGYNSIRFDDEVTRHLFWRNFIDPYRREWADGCSRWDLIDLVRATWTLRPEGIEWPLREDGRPSFKLEELATANQLEQAQAHDAVSDVRATIALARLLKTRQPRLFDHIFSQRGKQPARELLDLENHRPVLHFSGMFGAHPGACSLVMPLAVDPINKNAIICYDLRQPPDDLLNLEAAEIADRLYTPTADLPEGVSRVALKRIHINKAPVMVTAKAVTPAIAERIELDLDACRQHWKLIHDQITDVALKTQMVHNEEFESSDDPEQGLYDGFVGNEDRNLCNQVCQLSPAEFDELDLPFKDKRLHELLFRYRARHYPESLNAAERDEWENWRRRKLDFAPDGGLTLSEALQLIRYLQEQHRDNEQSLRVLEDLQQWCERLS